MIFDLHLPLLWWRNKGSWTLLLTNLPIFSYSFCVLLKISLYVLILLRYFPLFSCRNIIILFITFWSIIQYQVGSRFFSHEYPVFSATVSRKWKHTLFPSYSGAIIVINQKTIVVWVSFWLSVLIYWSTPVLGWFVLFWDWLGKTEFPILKQNFQNSFLNQKRFGRQEQGYMLKCRIQIKDKKTKIKKIQDINSGSKKFSQNRSSFKNNRGGGTETETEREREGGWMDLAIRQIFRITNGIFNGTPKESHLHLKPHSQFQSYH